MFIIYYNSFKLCQLNLKRFTLVYKSHCYEYQMSLLNIKGEQDLALRTHVIELHQSISNVKKLGSANRQGK